MSVRRFILITPEGKGVYGELDEDGVVKFAIDAGPESTIRGTELFNRMMRYFGADAHAICGVWRKNERTGAPSANIDKVNELTAAGMDLMESVKYTWTVTRAKKLGFTKVSIIGQPAGNAGAYTAIDVLMEK